LLVEQSATKVKILTKTNNTAIMLVAAAIMLFSAVFVIGDPLAPLSITPGYTSTFDGTQYSSQTEVAIAGNITALVISGLGQTQAWQGYYGNVTATITLDDANNYTFYNWSETEPQGEIYATLNSSIVWDNVQCFNMTAQGGYASANETTMEDYFNIDYDDADGVSETYTLTNHDPFQIGSRTITGCPTTYIFENDTQQTANFTNILLYDNTSAINQTGWIYATILEDRTAGSSTDIICYNGQQCDFQILVNEDGHGTDVATTTYYFWVELS